MASSLISTPPPTTTTMSRDSHVHKKKKKHHSKNHHHHHQQQQQQNQIKWKSPAQQNLYSSKLRQALAGASLSGAAVSAGGKAVRETADRVLASAARGKTRWSRAILTNRLKLKFRKKNHNKRQKLVTAPVGAVRSRKTRFSVLRLKGKTVPAVQKKVRFLGRLVPGCRKEPLPVILEEAIDYIPALEMQVRAMTVLADLLLGSSSSTYGAGAGDAPAS